MKRNKHFNVDIVKQITTASATGISILRIDFKINSLPSPSSLFLIFLFSLYVFILLFLTWNKQPDDRERHTHGKETERKQRTGYANEWIKTEEIFVWRERKLCLAFDQICFKNESLSRARSTSSLTQIFSFIYLFVMRGNFSSP